MKTFQEFLFESKQVGTVYHFTRFTYLLNILEDDFLKGIPTHFYGDVFKKAISTTRDKNFIKTRNGSYLSIGGGEVGIVLDGTKMSTQFKCKPVNDMWDKDEKKFKKLKYSYGDEQEELWYGHKISKDRGIKGIRKYIKKIIFTDKFAEVVSLGFNYPISKHSDISFRQKYNWTTETTRNEKINDLVNFFKETYNIEVVYQGSLSGDSER